MALKGFSPLSVAIALEAETREWLSRASSHDCMPIQLVRVDAEARILSFLVTRRDSRSFLDVSYNVPKIRGKSLVLNCLE